MTAANDNARATERGGQRPPLFATTLRLLSSLDAMPDPAGDEPRRAERS